MSIIIEVTEQKIQEINDKIKKHNKVVETPAQSIPQSIPQSITQIETKIDNYKD